MPNEWRPLSRIIINGVEYQVTDEIVQELLEVISENNTEVSLRINDLNSRINNNYSYVQDITSFLPSYANVISDWNETNTSSYAYILNKNIVTDELTYLRTAYEAFKIEYDDDNYVISTALTDLDSRITTLNNNSFSGDYDDLTNKPTIPTVPITSTTVTENDTNPVSGGAVYDKFEDLIGAAPAALDTLAEIASALNNDADLAGTLTTQIGAKIPKVSNPTTDNFASFNSDGTIKDSGVSASSFITTETQPDWNETNTSSAAYIQNKPNIICYDDYNSNNSISFGPNNIGINVVGIGDELNLNAPVVCINDFTINDNSEILNSNGENVVLKILTAYSEEFKRIYMNADESEIDDNTLANDIYKVIFYDAELDEISEEYIQKTTIGILVHTDNIQYLIKNGVAKYRIYENDNWTEWQNTNVKPDWNANSGSAAEILNKPTISTTVTQNDTNPVSGGAVYAKFADLIGSAPAALDTLQEIATALNNDADLAGTLTTQISSKVPKVSNPTTDNFASFNSDGTIKDSGHSHSDYITSIKTVNNESLVGSGNIVISGLPQVSASDNGKILMVVNGQWQLVSPSVLYTGQGVPNNAQGNNGDIYMQTD